MIMTTMPRGTVKGDTWTYTDESMKGGEKVKTRVIIKEPSPSAYTFKIDMAGADGKWATVMESKSTTSKLRVRRDLGRIPPGLGSCANAVI